MARAINRLTARFVDTAKTGKHRDGGGLVLVVGPTGNRKWAFIYERGGKEHTLGFGAAGRGAVSLVEAREKAEAARKLLREGMDPLAAKRALPKGRTDIPTFGEFADDYCEEVKVPSLRNRKHAAQWSMTLNRYCAAMRDKPVDQITTEDMLTVLRPLWLRIPETAARTRARIETVLDAAKAKGLRSGENPARWRGHLALMLPKRLPLSRGHHAAMPFERVPEFIAQLRTRESVAALALEFVILTAARTGEVVGASFAEIDLDKAVWTVPAARMKARREHRVPLCDRAVAIVRKMAEVRQSEFVFPGLNRPRLSNMAMEMVLRRMKIDDATVHGFRSAFRDWAAETTPFPSEVVEMALAHAVANKTEAAYRRGDLFDKRRALMVAWAGSCDPPKADNVVPLSSRSASNGQA